MLIESGGERGKSIASGNEWLLFHMVRSLAMKPTSVCQAGLGGCRQGEWGHVDLPTRMPIVSYHHYQESKRELPLWPLLGPLAWWTWLVRTVLPGAWAEQGCLCRTGLPNAIRGHAGKQDGIISPQQVSGSF